jgi:hypothetical protein
MTSFSFFVTIFLLFLVLREGLKSQSVALKLSTIRQPFYCYFHKHFSPQTVHFSLREHGPTVDRIKVPLFFQSQTSKPQ